MGMIVAIGGGENSRIRPNGTMTPYELEPIDNEIVRFSGIVRPNFLFLGHAISDVNIQKKYFEHMSKIYKNKFDCECKNLLSTELSDLNYCKQLIDWADIIYVGGGSTKDLISTWTSTGFDKLLKYAYEDDKVLCGISAGANCWFDKALTKQDGKYEVVKCLGLIDGFFVPHAEGRKDILFNLTHGTDDVCIATSCCAAVEIMNDYFRVIEGDAVNRDIKPFVEKLYWQDGNFLDIIIDNKEHFEYIDELTKKETSKVV